MANTSNAMTGVGRGPRHGPGDVSVHDLPPFPTGAVAAPGGPPGAPGGGAPGGGTTGGGTVAGGATGGPGTGPPGTGGAPGGPGTGPLGTGGAPGGPGTGTGGGTTGGTNGGTTTGGTTSGGPSGGTSQDGYYVDPGFNSSIAAGFMNLLQNATSPDALDAQSIILRRIALEGDVVGSRVPPPRNITEIGGYLNFLTTNDQPEMRAQTLAGILGVAGPNPPLGWLASGRPQLTFVTVANDRPSGPSQASIPLSIAVRSDFGDAFKAALAALHARGCALPLQSGRTTLPSAAPGAAMPTDMLTYLGRTLDVVATTALVDPKTDPIALVRASGTSDPFVLAARVLAPGSVPVPAANYDALARSATGTSTVALAAAALVQLATTLASAGFYATPVPMPLPSSNAWAHLTNVTGLVKGVTKLGDELTLLYAWSDIQSSAFAGSLGFVWDGATFSMP